VTDLAIEVHGLTKAYRNVAVLAGVDLAVQRGSIQALLGVPVFAFLLRRWTVS